MSEPDQLAKLSPQQRQVLEQFKAGNMPPDARDGSHRSAPELIGALFAITQLVSEHTNAIDCYVDEDDSPELYELVWGDPDLPAELAVPLSPFGVPALLYKNPQSCSKLLTAFRCLSATDTSEYLDAANLATLCSALELAVERQSGLFGYYEQ